MGMLVLCACGAGVLLLGFLAGFFVKHLAGREILMKLELTQEALLKETSEAKKIGEAHAALREDWARLQAQSSAELQAYSDKVNFLQSAEARLLDSFKATAAEALQLSHKTFNQFAETHFQNWQNQADQTFATKNEALEALLQPLQTSLAAVDGKIYQLEKAREGAYQSLTEQVRGLFDHQIRLEDQTRKLSQALRTPHVRGQWGEIQLRRLVELSGMLEHVDFTEQSLLANEVKRLRPDMVVSMPNGRSIAIDAKVPLESYLNAMDALDEPAKKLALVRHARHVRDRISELSHKNYWKDLPSSPEFVILFLPAEPLLSAAFSEDPDLLEWSANQGVIPATPVSLLALLKTVAYGWRQETMALEAKNISSLGRELYDRIAVLMEHWDDLRKNLQKSCESYNKALSSMEARVIPTARKLQAYEAATQRALPTPQPLLTPVEEASFAALL